MKKERKRTAKKPSRGRLPAPMSGLAFEDLKWDYASPLASLIFDDLKQEPPAEEFWATVSGAAIFSASRRLASEAEAEYEVTTAPILRRLRRTIWLYREAVATRNAMRLWSALLTKLAAAYPEASDGQLWVLIRDTLRELWKELREVEGDGR